MGQSSQVVQSLTTAERDAIYGERFFRDVCKLGDRDDAEVGWEVMAVVLEDHEIITDASMYGYPFMLLQLRDNGCIVRSLRDPLIGFLADRDTVDRTRSVIQRKRVRRGSKAPKKLTDYDVFLIVCQYFNFHNPNEEAEVWNARFNNEFLLPDNARRLIIRFRNKVS